MASLLAKRELALQAQAQATQEMAVANLKKLEALEDQVALSLFTMPMDADLMDEAREYLNLKQREEMERLKQRMEAERRVAELEAMAHDRLVKERSAEVAKVTESRGTASALSPIAPAITPLMSGGGGSPSTPIALPLPTSTTAAGTSKSSTSLSFHVN